MRTLLEIHYDDVHVQRWKQKDGKGPDRKGNLVVDVLGRVGQLLACNTRTRLLAFVGAMLPGYIWKNM